MSHTSNAEGNDKVTGAGQSSKASAPRWRRYLRFWRADPRADVDDELAFHLEMRVRDLESAGLSPSAARAEAERIFGNLGVVRDACLVIDERRHRKATRAEVVGDMWNDLKFAARALRKTPGFAAMAIVCIALGVCVTTTTLSAVNAILIRPLPYPNGDQLVAVYSQNIARNYHGTNISYPDYASWRDDNKSFAALGIWTWTTKTIAEGETERLYGAYVSANLFPLLGASPMLGRNFLPAEETPGNERVAILSYGVWQRRYAGDKTVIGRAVTIDAARYTIVGVMPPKFNFPDRGQIWVPFVVDLAREGRGSRGYAGAIGRLKPGVTLEAAQTDLETLSQRLEKQYADDNTGWSAELTSLRDDLTGTLRRPLMIFLGAVALVLLIACANVANLMLARGASRGREIAIRTALGAARGRLVRQLLTESMLIAAVGGVAGAAIGAWGVRLLQFVFPSGVPFYISLDVDPRAMAFAAAIIALTGVMCGIIPALRTSRVDINASLRDGARSGDGTGRVNVRNALVVTEVALSVVLMVGAMLLIRSYRAYQSTDLGFEEHGILTARVTIPRVRYATASARTAFFQRLTDRLRTMPGVTMVGSAQGIPFSGWDMQSEINVFGRPPAQKNQEVVSHYQYVFPDYFKAMKIPLLRGRMLNDADRDTLAQVGVVNELFVKKVFPNEDPLGKRVKLGSADSPDPWITIVGVTRDFRHYRLPQPMGPAVYVPYAEGPSSTQTFVLRTSRADPTSLAAEVRAAVHGLDPQVAAYDIKTMQDAVDESLWRQRLQGQVLGTFAVLALLLAMVGIYGVISYTVAQRTREIGVRVALGAQRSHVLAMVLRQGARLAAMGISIGIVAALLLSRTLATLLYGVSATDLISFIGVPLLLGAVTLLATYIPALRATRVDPLIAIRTE